MRGEVQGLGRREASGLRFRLSDVGQLRFRA